MSTVQAHGDPAATAPGTATRGRRPGGCRAAAAGAAPASPASTACAPWRSPPCSSSTSTPPGCPAGFLGVDVFFVVSGFLITTLLVRERARTGTVDLPGFWTRRARRLLPALLLCVPASVLLARLTEGDLLVGIGRQVTGAAHLHVELARDRRRLRLLRRRRHRSCS